MVASIAHAAVSRADWGKTADGQPISIFTLTDQDLTVRITNFGARIVSIEAPDRDGKKADVVLGYDKASQYVADKSTYFGAVVGRYGNRIAKGTFSIDGWAFHVPRNDKTNALHGGTVGFDRKMWTGREFHDAVEMTLLSPDGDMGFPGALTVRVRYTLEGRSLHISYSASSTRPTVVNLTNHSYFNLAGNGKGTVLDQVLTIPADRYTPVDAELIPTSELAPVTQTPFDFRTATAIGARINAPNEQLRGPAVTIITSFLMEPPRHCIWRRTCLILRAAAPSQSAPPNQACSSTRATSWMERRPASSASRTANKPVFV